jgi:hypothetical protein
MGDVRRAMFGHAPQRGVLRKLGRESSLDESATPYSVEPDCLSLVPGRPCVRPLLSVYNEVTASGTDVGYGLASGGVIGLTESASTGSLLNEVQVEQVVLDLLEPEVGNSSTGPLYLYDTADSWEAYQVPHSVPALISSDWSNPGVAPVGQFVSGSPFGFVPSTNAMTAHGLPTE